MTLGHVIDGRAWVVQEPPHSVRARLVEELDRGYTATAELYGQLAPGPLTDEPLGLFVTAADGFLEAEGFRLPSGTMVECHWNAGIWVVGQADSCPVGAP